MSKSLDQDTQKQIFLKLVDAQDTGMSVEESRQRMCGEFGIDVSELLEVERLGRVNQWPPLS